MDILTSIELWVGLGLLLLLGVLLAGGGGDRKRQAARIARVTRRGPHITGGDTAQSLRRKDPNEGSKFGRMIADYSVVEKLRARLEMAGMTITPQQFLLRAGIIALVITVGVAVLGKPILLGILAGILIGLGLPHMVVGIKIKKRGTLFLKLFPEGIDLIVRGLRAGLPVAESFQVVAKEIPPPVGNLFAQMSQQVALGVPMEKALSDAAAKLGLTEFNFFVTTIILQRETGGNLGEILNNLSEVLRQRQMMKLKIGALSSEARASAYIVGALPFLVFGILTAISPNYLNPLYDDFRGNIALLGACGMMFTGGFIMKRMTQLEI